MRKSLKITTALAAGACLTTTGLVASAGGPQTFGSPDVQVCLLFNLTQFAREGQLNGLSIATTSYNAGTENLDWYPNPDSEHPFIAYNLFRIKDGVIQQIGVSWIKHGFFATNTSECEQYNFCSGPGGFELKPDCSDTYGAGLNASRTYLGPRYEVDPWTGDYNFQGGFLQQNGSSGSGIDRLMIVHDDDLDPALNPGASYIAEGYYVAADDTTPMSNGSYRNVSVTGFSNFSGNSNDRWNFSSPSSVSPTIGFAIESWGGDLVTMAIDERPAKGFSDDGRSLLSVKTFDNGDGTWRYEYALYNVDMDGQVGEFTVPVPDGVTITDAEWYGVTHYESFNARGSNSQPIDNQPWDIAVGANSVTFSTDSNPLRWGMMFNFSFTADTAPAAGDVCITNFRTPGANICRTSQVPSEPIDTTCAADFNGDGVVDGADFGTFGAAFGSSIGQPAYNEDADFNADGTIDGADFGEFGAQFGSTDC